MHSTESYIFSLLQLYKWWGLIFYFSGKDFNNIFVGFFVGQHREFLYFSLHNNYLLKGTILCLPNASLREQVIWELYVGRATCHFGRDKTITIVEDHFFWLSLKNDMAKIVSCCRKYQLSKGRKKNIGLYMPHKPWQDVSMNFMLDFARTIRQHDSIFVIVDCFSKMTHYILCSKIIDSHC